MRYLCRCTSIAIPPAQIKSNHAEPGVQTQDEQTRGSKKQTERTQEQSARNEDQRRSDGQARSFAAIHSNILTEIGLNSFKGVSSSSSSSGSRMSVYGLTDAKCARQFVTSPLASSDLLMRWIRNFKQQSTKSLRRCQQGPRLSRCQRQLGLPRSWVS